MSGMRNRTVNCIPIKKIIVTIQSYLDFAMLHLDVASRQIDLQEKVLVYASITHIFLQICLALNSYK